MPVTSLADAPSWDAPSRSISEVASADVMAAEQTTLRIVTLDPGHGPRHPHHHARLEELVHVLEGRGQTWIEGERFDVGPGDTVRYPVGKRHATVNVGDGPLRLACFFPSADIADDFHLDESTTVAAEGG